MTVLGIITIPGVKARIAALEQVARQKVACYRKLQFEAMTAAEERRKRLRSPSSGELTVGSLTRHALNQISKAAASVSTGRSSKRRMRPSEVAKLFEVHRNTIALWLKGEGDPPEGFAAAYANDDAAALAELAHDYAELRLCRRDAMSASKARLFDG